MRGISLTLEQQERVFLPGHGDAFRVRVTAHDAEMMPVAIFLHEKRLMDPYTGTEIDDFVAIISAFDASLYPANIPDSSQVPPYFRKDSFDVLVPGQVAAATLWQEVQAQVMVLVEAYNRLDVLAPGETVRIGDPLEDEGDEGSVSEAP